MIYSIIHLFPKVGRVSHWKNDAMVLRWAAASFIDAEKAFRRIMSYQDLWMLKANLDELVDDICLDNTI